MEKVAIVCSSLSIGGAERVTVRLAEYMYNSGIDVSIITITKGKEEYSVADGVKRFSLSINQKKLSYIGSVIKLKKIVKENSINSVIVMGVPTVVYTLLVLSLKNVKVVVSERGNPYEFLGKKIVQKVSLKLINFADGYIFQTEGAKSFFGKRIQEKSTVISNPLVIQELPDLYIGEKDKTIVSVGRLVPKKNHIMLIEAFSRIVDKYCDYNLIIYGEGVLHEELRRHIKDIGLSDRIFLPGNKENVLELIKSASVFVITSDTEGMPNALIEAMALGLPCVSTDCPCGGPKELITDGENGYLVPVGNVNVLVDKISFILDNPDIADKIGKNAISIRDRLDIEVIGKQWINVLS